MRTILYVIRKEFLQLRQDPRMLAVVILPPVLQLILLGYAANLDVKNLPLIVYDADKSSLSREFISAFPNSGYFRITRYADDIRDIDHIIERGEASMALVIPSDFSRKLTANRSPELQIIVDGSETNSATLGFNYASLVVMDYSRKMFRSKLIALKHLSIKQTSVEPQIRIWFNPELKSRNFMIPGVLALILMVMTVTLTAQAIVKEKETGTIEQLIVTPIKPFQLIVGKLTPFALISVVDIILVLSVANFWFRVPLRGSVPLLFGLCFIFLLTTLGLGLLISTLVRTQQQAMMTAMFFVMMPMIFLAGFAFPIENMPKIVQAVTYFLPLRYFMTIVRGIFLKGSGLPELWDEAAMLVVFGTASLTLSVLRFKKKY
jgi:ABC-2 type transport system permease protein